MSLTTTLREMLQTLAAGERLGHDATRQAFELIMDGAADPVQVGALLGMIQALGISEAELSAAAAVMRERATPVTVPAGRVVIDTCGTGGDHGHTFNISTAAALVAAGAGRPHGVVVAKHGNRSVTSRSGSSEVLEQLGVRLDVSAACLTRCLDEAGLAFCFAPSHHPAMKHVVPVRKALGIRTIFNLLGPLANPAGARRQLLGVFAPDLVRPLAEVLRRLGAERAIVACGQSGTGGRLDEIATTGPTTIAELDRGEIREQALTPESLGLERVNLEALAADSPATSAAIIRAVLDGETGPPRQITCLNAAAALVVGGVAESLEAGLEAAGQAIDSGAAATALERLVAVSGEGGG